MNRLVVQGSAVIRTPVVAGRALQLMKRHAQLGRFANPGTAEDVPWSFSNDAHLGRHQQDAFEGEVHDIYLDLRLNEGKYAKWKRRY